MWPARFLLRVPALPARVPHLSRPFQSPAHPEKLYPGSTWDDRFISNDVPKDERGFNGHIPMKDLQITYSLSSGPGGQNVNRNATKVDLRFRPRDAAWLSPDVREKVLEKYASDLTKDGYFVVRSDRTRSQMMNQAECMRKLREALWAAIAPPPPGPADMMDEVELEKKRKKALKMARERVQRKRLRTDVKQSRKPPAL